MILRFKGRQGQMCGSEKTVRSLVELQAREGLEPSVDRTSHLPPGVAEQIHDGPLQELAAASLKLAGVRHADGLVTKRDLEEVSRLIDSASSQLRSIVVGDSARAVAPDLHQQLRGLCALFEAETGIKCRLALHPEHLGFEAGVGDTVFRSIRELLSNVRKHAEAKSVRVSSAYVGVEQVAISVADNGVGLSPAHWRRAPFEGGGFGLWSIEHRLESLGGRLEIDGDSGVCVVLLLPRRFLIHR